MKPEEFKQLQELLGKLEIYLGARYCIIPRHHADGCYLALYDEKGKMVRDHQGPDIETVSGLLKVQINQNKK